MLKASDIAPTCLNKDFDRLIESQTRTYAYEKTIETRVYEAVLQLMDLLEPLCETRDLRKSLSLRGEANLGVVVLLAPLLDGVPLEKVLNLLGHSLLVDSPGAGFVC